MKSFFILTQLYIYLMYKIKKDSHEFKYKTMDDNTFYDYRYYFDSFILNWNR